MGKGMFKTCFFGGFKKGDVLSYIDEMDKMSREYEGKLHTEVDELKKALSSTNTIKTDSDSGNKKIEAALESANKQLADFEEKKGSLENEISNINMNVLQKNLELDNLRHENLMLQQQLVSADTQLCAKDEEFISLKQQTEQLVKKAADFSKIEEQIAWVMLAARKSADTMIEDAKSETVNLKQAAYKKLSELNTGVSKFNSEIVIFREKTKYFYDVSDDMLKTIFDSAKQLELNITTLTEKDKKAEATDIKKEEPKTINGYETPKITENYHEIF
jgi:chromosome segregation ATPase